MGMFISKMNIYVRWLIMLCEAKAMSMRFQSVNLARHLNAPIHYLQNILERPRLWYQTLSRKSLLRPTRRIGSRHGVEGTFCSGAVLQRDLQT